MKITSLKQYKGTTFEVELDDERKIYLHIDVITDFGLGRGVEIERDELKKIIYASNMKRAYNYALHCLDYRDYSSRDMYRKIAETYKNEKLCRAVVVKLEKAGLIDDRRYAEKLARKYVESKKYGYRRAKREIMLKGIDEFISEDALAQYDELYEENLMHLLETKHYRNLTDRDDRKSVEKVKNSLAMHGYGYDEINRCIREYFDNAEISEE